MRFYHVLILLQIFIYLNLFAEEDTSTKKGIKTRIEEQVKKVEGMDIIPLPESAFKKDKKSNSPQKKQKAKKEKEDPSHTNVEYYYVKTTDNVQMNWGSVSFRNHRRNLEYPYPAESKQGWEYGAEGLLINGYSSQDYFTGGRFLLMGGRKFSERFQSEVRLGPHVLSDSATHKKRLIFAGDLVNYFVFMDLIRGLFGVKRDYAYIYLIQPGGISEHLTVINFYSTVNIRYSEHFQSRIRTNYFLISDSNRKFVTDANLLYGISTGTPWIWAGVGAERTTHTKTMPNYWSPGEFFAYGFRSEAVFPIIRDDITGFLSANIHKLEDRDTHTKGTGYDLTVKLTYGLREESNISAYWIRIRSKQDDHEWISDQFGLSLNLFF